MAKCLVAFYSRADENYVSGTIRNLKIGNTERAAKVIGNLVGADMFKIEQAEPYSKIYNECIEQARKDQRENARPALLQYPKSLDEYDKSDLGFPNYWSTMPMAVFTFLEKFDFSGKTVYPFCTHEGSGMGSSLSDIKKLCPKAQIKQGLALHGGSVEQAKDKIENWVKQDK